ncbi:MAG TPA: tRNA lysidine(34) synthetase TilS [Bryobacteraceae bacterium]|nr:tRNA lysidine(34) synthetase TilS [Bryobacteraceae bacterium]
MLNRIAQLIAHHQMFASGSRIGVAVSGGADSVFLLHALRELRWSELSVLHVEHGIRGEASRQDAAFVQALAEKYALPFHIHSADVPAIQDNQEQAARDVRRKFFAELIAAGTVDRIATGHTRTDQAETVLFRILRGAGSAGIAGILPVTKEGLVRPLLEIDRSEIEDWLRKRNIPWREDASNQDRSYARNRLRHEILPLLREAFNPNLDHTLANMATVARDEERYWQSTLPAPQSPIPNPQTLPLRELREPAVARRLIRAAIAAAKGDLRQIDFAHVERILEMARSPGGHDRAQLPGLDVIRSFEWIRLVPANASSAVPDFSMPIQAPGSVELPGSGTRITLQVLEKSESPKAYATVGNELDWQRLTVAGGVLPSLELRNWRPGDQYQPQGQSKEQKIKNLFQDARIPLWERGYWPIITYNGIIVWTQKFGAAAEFAAGPCTRVVLRVEVSLESCNRASGV